MKQVFTDASLTGWGGVCQGQAVGGVWPRSQRHINLLELETVQLAGELVCIATEESFFVLRYLSEKVAASQENNEGVTEDGIEDAFEDVFYTEAEMERRRMSNASSTISCTSQSHWVP
ncbi:hypothetical protein DPEC_G00362930 [Dallia pectoralis]|nr:hypothetical protein DPEC_G00362930 [Dallia pectoralis]